MIDTESAHIILNLEGELITNSQGIKHILNWYHEAKKHHNSLIKTCCSNLDWIDANLAALWSALIHRLKKDNNNRFFSDENLLSKRFSILFRNGFTAVDGNSQKHRGTFIQNASFGPADSEAFSNYIETELLGQQQMSKLPAALRGLLESNLYELYQNVFRHAGTNEPFFVCGQYFPKRKELVVSMVDLGQTFLPPIFRTTQGKISTQRDAIDWALQGNSELGNEGGGLALKCINDYFGKTGHCLQIVTGNAFWDSSCIGSLLGPHRELVAELPGTMVNLIFQINLTS